MCCLGASTGRPDSATCELAKDRSIVWRAELEVETGHRKGVLSAAITSSGLPCGTVPRFAAARLQVPEGCRILASTRLGQLERRMPSAAR